MLGTSMLWVEGQISSYFLPEKMSMPTKCTCMREHERGWRTQYQNSWMSGGTHGWYFMQDVNKISKPSSEWDLLNELCRLLLEGGTNEALSQQALLSFKSTIIIMSILVRPVSQSFCRQQSETAARRSTPDQWQMKVSAKLHTDLNQRVCLFWL